MSRADEIESALESFKMENAQGVLIEWDFFTTIHQSRMVAALDRIGLPAIWQRRVDVEAGGLMS